MPGAYHIDPARRVIFIRAWGKVTDREVQAIGQAVRTDRRFNNDFGRIENLEQVTEFAVSGVFATIAADRQRAAPPPRRAFVVQSDAVFGMIRMLELLADADQEQFLITRDLAEGFRWVGLESTASWPEDTPVPT